MADAGDKIIGIIPAVIRLKIVENVLDRPKKRKCKDILGKRKW